ncbi:hypothetical protein BD408DRAFT_409769 [Parasitella parasitica]|nr:hypothetical protein BD408DRAFT_409769 [Parasitella parasitica]
MLAYIGQSPMDPMAIMGYLLTSGAVCLALLKHRFDTTVRLLFEVSKEPTVKESDPKDTKSLLVKITGYKELLRKRI